MTAKEPAGPASLGQTVPAWWLPNIRCRDEEAVRSRDGGLNVAYWLHLISTTLPRPACPLARPAALLPETPLCQPSPCCPKSCQADLGEPVGVSTLGPHRHTAAAQQRVSHGALIRTLARGHGWSHSRPAMRNGPLRLQERCCSARRAAPSPTRTPPGG